MRPFQCVPTTYDFSINEFHLASYNEEANTRMELHITMANYHAKRYRWTKSSLVTIVRVCS